MILMWSCPGNMPNYYPGHLGNILAYCLDKTTLLYKYHYTHLPPLFIIMLSVNFFCNISSYDILAYITKNYIALIYYAKIVHLLCQFHAGKVGFSAVCQAIYS